MPNEQKQCMECDAPLASLQYAVYRKNQQTAVADEETIAGYLCDSCWKKHKMKPLRGNHEQLKKLEQLKALLMEK